MLATDYARTFQDVVSRLRLPARIARNRLLGREEPVVAFLIVNNGCNLKCSYCFGDYPARDIPDFTAEECFSFIDAFREMGTRLMVVHGGETLMRPDIGRIVDRIKDRGMACALVTNGYFLAEKADAIRRVDSLCISLDGRREGNDVNRGEGAYDRTVAAIRLAKERGFRLRVNATLTSRTHADVDHLCELAREIGFLVEFCFLYKELSPRNQHLFLEDEPIREALGRILAYKRKGYPVLLSESTIEYALRWPTTYKKIRFEEGEIPESFRGEARECRWGRSIVILDADGSLIPCFPQNDSFKALNVRDVGLQKAYAHVLATNKCRTCYHLTINEYNRLVDLDAGVIANQVRVNLRDIAGRAR